MDRLDRHKRRNQKGFGISPHQLVIAQNWTNPDLPLWLCHHGKKALPAILQKIFGLEQLTPDSLKKERDRNLSLACCYPICEISSASDGGYELILRVGSKRWREKCLA